MEADEKRDGIHNQKGVLEMKYELLLAERSFSNESEGKEMFGCLADDSGKVVCYFPTKSSFAGYADKFKNCLEVQK